MLIGSHCVKIKYQAKQRATSLFVYVSLSLLENQCVNAYKIR